MANAGELEREGIVSRLALARALRLAAAASCSIVSLLLLLAALLVLLPPPLA